MRALSGLVDDCYAVNSGEVLGEYLFRSPWQRLKMRMGVGPAAWGVAAQLQREYDRYMPDCVWIDQGSLVGRNTLAAFRRGKAKLVHYSLDSLNAPGMLTQTFAKAICEYDYCITSKSHEISKYLSHGARAVIITGDGIDPALHRPVIMSGSNLREFGCDVVFIGQAMRRRAQLIAEVALRTNAAVRTYGRGWRSALQPYGLAKLSTGWVFGDEYARALCGTKIALGMLNESVGDQQTTRCYEIPACGVFMLAQRTPSLCEVFREGQEAAYFESAEELVDKVNFYLIHERERRRIAEAGRSRVQTIGCTWRDRMAELLERMRIVSAAADGPGVQSL